MNPTRKLKPKSRRPTQASNRSQGPGTTFQVPGTAFQVPDTIFHSLGATTPTFQSNHTSPQTPQPPNPFTNPQPPTSDGFSNPQSQSPFGFINPQPQPSDDFANSQAQGPFGFTNTHPQQPEPPLSPPRNPAPPGRYFNENLAAQVRLDEFEYVSDDNPLVSPDYNNEQYEQPQPPNPFENIGWKEPEFGTENQFDAALTAEGEALQDSNSVSAIPDPEANQHHELLQPEALAIVPTTVEPTQSTALATSQIYVPNQTHVSNQLEVVLNDQGLVVQAVAHWDGDSRTLKLTLRERGWDA